MKCYRLFEIISLVDDDLILQAMHPPRRNHRPLAVAAACLALCALSLPLLGNLSSTKSVESEASSPASDAPIAPGFSPVEAPADGAQAASFLSYSGPVLPLTTQEDTPLTATRHLSFDVSDPDTAHIFDHYEITNPTQEEITVTFLYPVVGALGDFDQLEPRMGEWNRMITPFAGRYAGSFQSAHGSGEAEGTHNLKTPDEWTDYAAVLENGDLEYALSDWEDLSEVVTVYEFSDITGPTAQYHAASLAVDFVIQADSSTVMTYGFNGGSWDDSTGYHQYDFFVPDGKRRDTNPKLLILRGDDLNSYHVQGYSDGGCTTPISGVSCTVTRTEMTVERLIDRLCRAYLQENSDHFSGLLNTDPQTLPLRLYRQTVAELLTEYGVLSETPTDRYVSGRLDELISEALTLDRIFYFRAPAVTIAPGESYSMTVHLQKCGSFDFFGSNSGREGIFGYEFLTTTGSALTFLEQRFSLELADDYTPSADSNLHATLQTHNLVPALSANQEILLDLSQEQYYFHISAQ